ARGAGARSSRPEAKCKPAGRRPGANGARHRHPENLSAAAKTDRCTGEETGAESSVASRAKDYNGAGAASTDAAATANRAPDFTNAPPTRAAVGATRA